jgi:glutathione-regulated potassium-efflux system ancillary protein KefF
MPSSLRVLVVYAHAAPHRSRINRRLAQAARDVAGVHVQDLYETYPDFYIDAAREQRLVEQADTVAFVHPLRWYGVPALLKEWFDVVLEPGWAYGRDSTALRGKRYWQAVTTGSPADAYRAGAIHGRPFSDFLAPFEQTAALCGMQWLAPLVFHGADSAGEDAIDAHVEAFRLRLAQLASPGSLE